MADSLVPVKLNVGLDTVTPPLMTEPGALIDSLNYEMTSHFGYRRIDGYERYDGWINGDVSNYYKLSVTIDDAGVEYFLTAGQTLYSVSTGGSVYSSIAIATVVSYQSGQLVYVPTNRDIPIIPSGTGLRIDPGSSSQLTANSIALSGVMVDPAQTFVDNIRTYSAALRETIFPATTAVAGLHWFRRNLVVAYDTVEISASTTEFSSLFPGMYLAYQGIRYLLVDKVSNGGNGTLYLEPAGSYSSSNVLQIVGKSSVITNLTGTTVNSVTYASSEQAYLARLKTTETDSTKGAQVLQRSVFGEFSNGALVSGQPPKVGSLYTVQSGGNALYLILKRISLVSGTYAGGNAFGYYEFHIDHPNSSLNRNYLQTGDAIKDFSGTNTHFNISSISIPKIAGTKALRRKGTRYQVLTHNFYGNEDSTEGYGVTGASRGFWFTAHVAPVSQPSGGILVSEIANAWGNIVTDPLYSLLDQPRYLAVQGGVLLALGFEGGSVIFSVGGEPLNYSGVEGAFEVATGDDITGLLEGVSDSLLVFGRRAIRRATGNTPSTLEIKTVVANSGCFDYTAVNVGGVPVYAGPSGITTLQQSETYGDFTGQRSTYKVSTTLVPKLVPDYTDSEAGGAAMALPVRSKDQYRLWLATGEVITVTFTSEGPKVMYSRYGQGADIRVPFAWTSELSDALKERIMIAWDIESARRGESTTGTFSTLPNDKHVYELDRGWGFDGSTFKHYFDTAHMFANSGVMYTGIEGIRMHGLGHGLATLDIKSSGIEDDFDQAYHTTIQDISLPRKLETFYPSMKPVTNYTDQANWGLGIKLRVNGTQAEGLTTTEPSHICQVLVLRMRSEGAQDNG